MARLCVEIDKMPPPLRATLLCLMSEDKVTQGSQGLWLDLEPVPLLPGRGIQSPLARPRPCPDHRQHWFVNGPAVTCAHLHLNLGRKQPGRAFLLDSGCAL